MSPGLRKMGLDFPEANRRRQEFCQQVWYGANSHRPYALFLFSEHKSFLNIDSRFFLQDCIHGCIEKIIHSRSFLAPQIPCHEYQIWAFKAGFKFCPRTVWRSACLFGQFAFVAGDGSPCHSLTAADDLLMIRAVTVRSCLVEASR